MPEAVISKIVSCISSAVGDEIKQDITSNRLEKANSTPSRIWDFINRDLCETLGSPDCMVARTNRGPWSMVVVYEKTSQYIFTFMREKRYEELRKSLKSRKGAHYVDALVRELNPDLLASTGQLYISEPEFKFNFDTEKIANIVQKIICDLRVPQSEIKHHALVLFESSNYHLHSVRGVMIDSNLDIVVNHDWSQYIIESESTVVEKTDNYTIASNRPERGLKLTSKATERKKANIRKVAEEDKKNG